MNVAQLTIEMAANVARLKTDMASARNTVDSTMNSIRKSASLAATALGAIGVGLSVNAFANWIKGAINAAAEADDLSQRIGVAVKELGGLQLAFSRGGVEAGEMQKSLARLSLGIANGDSSLKALGISTKNVDGSLRSVTDVLIDISNKFASTQDGVSKTAMAIDLFGKSGASLIPVLNAGGDSIIELNKIATQLGLTLSSETAAAAGEFEDTLELIGLASRGVANQVMAELLPTMQSLASEFFTLINTGNNLQEVASYISMALKGLFTVVMGGVEIMRTLLIMTQATAKVMMAFSTLDFKAAMGVFEQTEKTLKENWLNTLGSFDRLWNQTGNTAIGAAAKIVKGSMQSTKSMEDAEKAAEKLAEQQKKSLESAAALLESIVFENKTLQMSNIEREIAINLRKLEATGLEQNTALYTAYAEAIRSATVDNEAIKERIKLEEEAAKKAQKIAEDYAKEMDQINNQIGQSLTDALVNGGRSAKEFLIDMFRTLILRPIIQPIITGGTSAVMAALGMGGSGNAMASGGGTAGAFNIMSSVKSAYDAVSGGFMSLGTQAAFAAESMGSWLVTNTTGYLNSLGGSMMANSGAIGSFTSGAAGIGAGIMAGEFISGGRSVVGGNSLFTTGGGAAAGAALGTFVFPGVGTAIGGLVGGIVGGVVNAAFGSGAKKTTGASIQGTWTPEGIVDPRAFTSWEKKGGWFGGGGSGRDYSPINAELQTFMDDAVKSVGAAAKGYAEVLGLSTEALADATHFFIIPANSAEEVSKYLEGELKGFANQLAETLLVNTNYAKANESAIDTLARLATSINTVNGVFGALGFSLYETSLAGADAANVLVELLGGFDSFTQTMEFYYKNFYTEAERTAKATENLSKVFASINIEMPETNQGFRALVESARAAGDDVLLGNLLKLAPAFMEISNAAGKSAQAIAQERESLMMQLYQLTGNTAAIRSNELSKIDNSNKGFQKLIYAYQDLGVAVDRERQSALLSLSNSYNSFVNSLNSQISALETTKQVAQENVNSIKSVFDLLTNEISKLRGNVRGQSSLSAMAFISNAALTAQTTGYLPSQDELGSAIATVTQSLGSQNFASQLEMRKANLRFAEKLELLRGVAGNQLSIAERQLISANDQIEMLKISMEQAKIQYDANVERTNSYYNQVIANAQLQLNSLNKVDDSLGEVNASVNSVEGAIQGLNAAINSLRVPTSVTNSVGVGGGMTSQGSSWATATGVEALYYSILGRAPDPAGLAYWQGVQQSGASLAEISKVFQSSEEAQAMPKFANGGYYSGGMAMVGENGPELINFANPGMVYNSAQTGNLISSGISEEIRGLRQDNQEQARAMVQLQSRMNRLLERWDGDGLPEERVVTA